jgi:membrane-bound serine protease (ClpP class)
VQLRRTNPETGDNLLLGRVGLAREAVDPRGLVLVNGELWQARAAGEAIDAGETVRVERVDGLVLEVAAAEHEPHSSPTHRKEH